MAELPLERPYLLDFTCFEVLETCEPHAELRLAFAFSLANDGFCEP